MWVEVGGARLFFDVCGSKLRIGPSGAYEEAPTLLLVHGGPGFDHSVFRPYWDRFADVAQVVYLDLAGHGRSEGDDPARWTLDSWGGDIKGFCDALGVERPIVVGVSFGGFVAMSYATQFPSHPGALVLGSTAARTDLPRKLDAFEAMGGPLARTTAEGFWTDPTDAAVAEYMQVCMPLYTPRGDDPTMGERTIMRLGPFYHFAGVGREMMRYDLREDLARITCPTLVVGGDLDPVTPPADLEEIHGCLPDGAELHILPGCGHGAERAEPEAFERLVRDFLGRI